MDNGPNKRLKKESSPPLPSSVNIFLFIIHNFFIIFLKLSLLYGQYLGKSEISNIIERFLNITYF